MHKYLLLFVVLFISKGLFAQILTVLDNSNLQAIENVFIYSNAQSVLTNKQGKAQLDTFSPNDTLVFQHPSYKTLALSYQAIQDRNFEVRLQESVIDINEIVVSANSWEQNKNEVPNQIITLKTKEISNSNAQTAADLLGNANGIFIQKSQLGGGSPMIRGFASNKVLIVVDGVRMNNAIYRSGNLQNVISLDANSTQSAEIIMGPGSVIYGSDAIGGVMDFHSFAPSLSDSGLVFNANAMARYSSANDEQTGHFHFNLGGEKWGLLSSVTYSNFGDLLMGSQQHDGYTRPEYATRVGAKDTVIQNTNQNIQKTTGYKQLNLMQKISFRPSKVLQFNYGFHYSKLSDVPRYDRLIEYKNDELKYAEWYYGPQQWTMHNLKMELKKKAVLFDQAKLVAAYQDYQESRHDRKFGNNSLRERFEKVKIASLNLDFDKELNEKHLLFYGIELTNNLVNSTGHQTDILTGQQTNYASRYPDGSSYNSAAAYLSHKYKTNKQIIVNTGLRYNKVWLKADFDTTFYKFPFKKVEINNQAINGSVGVVYNNQSNWQFKLNASTGFRSPNIDDIGKVFDSEPGNVIVPNPGLGSEYAWNVDIGIAKTIQSKIQIEAAMFYTWLTNAMVRRDFLFNGQDSILYDGELSKVQALTNAAKARVYGFQLAINAEIVENLVFKTHLTYTKGEEQDETTNEYLPLRHAAPLFGSSHLIFTKNKFNIDFYSIYNGQIAFEDLAPTEQAKPTIYAKDANGDPYCPAWYTLNLKTHYQLNHYLQVNLAVENILDVRYRPYSSGIVSAGRNFVFSLRIKV